MLLVAMIEGWLTQGAPIPLSSLLVYTAQGCIRALMAWTTS